MTRCRPPRGQLARLRRVVRFPPLEEALIGFAGSAVVISHDRWVLDRIATHILAFEGDSRIEYRPLIG